MRRKPYLLLVLLLLFSLGCALTQMSANTARSAADPAQHQPAPPAAAQPGDLRLDPAAGGLPAFSMQFQASFSGKDGQDQPIQSALLLAEEMDAPQSARHLLARTDTGGQPPASLDIYQLAGDRYLVSTELGSQPGCSLLSADSPAQAVLRPADIILWLRPGDLIRQGESVGNVPADHYGLAGLSLGVGQAGASGGDVWVAQQGGYVLRASGWAEGAITLTGQPGSGRLEWNYTLDVASPVNIALPDDCRGLQSPDLPFPPNAAGISQHGSQIVFTSPLQPAELLDFYHTVLPQQGWNIDNESGSGALFTMDASKEGRAVQVLVEAQGASSQVTISLR